MSARRDPFALPRGPLGRVAGHLMARGNRRQQREALDLVDPGAGTTLLEIGFGPGVLALLALRRQPALTYIGVDPSEAMRAMASRRCADGVRQGAAFRIGTADALPVDDASVDNVVAVNNVRLWPDHAVAAQEIRPVLRPGGRVVLTHHAVRSRSRMQQRLALDAGQRSRSTPPCGVPSAPSSTSSCRRRTPSWSPCRRPSDDVQPGGSPSSMAAAVMSSRKRSNSRSWLVGQMATCSWRP